MHSHNNELKKLLAARNPAEYAESAVLMREVGEQMLARLDFVTLQPTVIVDLGCGVGDCTQLLRKRYPAAKLIAIDSADSMLAYAKKHLSIEADWLQAPAQNLSIAENSVDLLIANFLLPWCDDLQATLREWRRILRPDGLFMFTSLGPDTLHQLREFSLYLPHFMDMHDIGDALTHTGFADPVLDLDYFTITYQDQKKLFHELRATGMIAGDTNQIELQKNADDVYSLTYEVIFGHAWGPALHVDQVADEAGVVRIPVSHILRR
jgi:malonyl-CoA O-methyltransferase